MFRRLLVLQILLLAGLGSVFFLPQNPDIQPSAVIVDSLDRPDLPNQLIMSGWSAGPKIKPAEKELAALADDTNFARRNYYRQVSNPDGHSGMQTLQASIVLSGKDLNNSIHRPERCLPAQGMNIQSSTEKKVPLGGGRVLTMRKLTCTATAPDGKGGGKPYVYLNYYWFVGHDSFKHDHYGRTFQDMKDRLFSGYDQRWAYITVSTSLLSGEYKDESGRPVSMVAPSEEEADRMIGEFAAELAPEIIKLNEIKTWD